MLFISPPKLLPPSTPNFNGYVECKTTPPVTRYRKGVAVMKVNSLRNSRWALIEVRKQGTLWKVVFCLNFITPGFTHPQRNHGMKDSLSLMRKSFLTDAPFGLPGGCASIFQMEFIWATLTVISQSRVGPNNGSHFFLFPGLNIRLLLVRIRT